MTQDLLRHEMWTMQIPLARAVGTPAGPFKQVYAVALRLRDRHGVEGVAYASALDLATMDRIAAIMARLLEERGGNLDPLLEIERHNGGAAGDHAGRSAVCAISMAVWDLLGRRRGLPCAALWGNGGARDELDAYASFFFSDLSLEALLEEARAYRARGYRLAKMRAGRPGAEDEARFDAMCEIFSEPRSIAVETFFTFTGSRIETFVGGVSGQPLWIEDPAPYGSIGQLGHKDLIAAGETCISTYELVALHRAGIDRLILDVQFLGGPLQFLEAARTLLALGCRVGSHTKSHESLHLLAALPQSMPVEVFDWWQPIFNEEPTPDSLGRLAVQGPGLGRTLNEKSLEAYGQKII
jgi:L-alanine-DL-glutamate epimerase-like enolase superfamily enzyme